MRVATTSQVLLALAIITARRGGTLVDTGKDTRPLQLRAQGLFLVVPEDIFVDTCGKTEMDHVRTAVLKARHCVATVLDDDVRISESTTSRCNGIIAKHKRKLRQRYFGELSPSRDTYVTEVFRRMQEQREVGDKCERETALAFTVNKQYMVSCPDSLRGRENKVITFLHEMTHMAAVAGLGGIIEDHDPTKRGACPRFKTIWDRMGALGRLGRGEA